MFTFLMPTSDGELHHLRIGARDLAHAFEQYAAEWWNQSLTASIGVWQNACLTARIVPVLNQQTGELEPLLQELKP